MINWCGNYIKRRILCQLHIDSMCEVNRMECLWNFHSSYQRRQAIKINNYHCKACIFAKRPIWRIHKGMLFLQAWIKRTKLLRTHPRSIPTTPSLRSLLRTVNEDMHEKAVTAWRMRVLLQESQTWFSNDHKELENGKVWAVFLAWIMRPAGLPCNVPGHDRPEPSGRRH